MTPLSCSFILSPEGQGRLPDSECDTCYPSQAAAVEVPHQAPDMCSQAHPNDVDRCPWDSQGLQGDSNTNYSFCSRKVKYPVPAHTAALM